MKRGGCKIGDNTRDAGWAVMSGILVKFGTAHGKSALVVRNALAPMGERGLPRPPRFFGTSKQKIITPTDLLRSIHNFDSLTNYS